MIVTTTHHAPGREVAEVLGIVVGEAILGANLIRDLFANVRDIIGGRSKAYQEVIASGRKMAMEDMVEEAEHLGADAIVAVCIDCESVGKSGGMLMVSINGTAVRLR